MHATINGMLTINGIIVNNQIIDGKVLEGTITSVCGILSLEMGVFGGIIVGLGVSFLHNRFYQVQFPDILSFLKEKDLFQLFLQLFICLLELSCFLFGLSFKI